MPTTAGLQHAAASKESLSTGRNPGIGLLDLATAHREAAQSALAKLANGSRQEDIDQRRANVVNARAVRADAQMTFDRQATLVTTSAVSLQNVDDARRAFDVAAAQVKLSEAALAELVNGPRVEDIETARAQLPEADASEALSRTQLSGAASEGTTRAGACA